MEITQKLIGLVWLLNLLIAPAMCQELPKLSSSRIAALTRDGDRLADQRDFQGALEKYTEAYQGVVSRIRGQGFLRSVQPSIFNRAQLGEEMLKMMREEYSEDDLLLMDSSYKVLGLVPPALDSAELMTKLLTEEVAGFYDPSNKRMVLIVEEDKPDPGWLGRLLGAKPAFDKQEQKTTLTHELTHALQDQLYDLNAMEKQIKDDDDMLLAFSALVEGDATLLMFAEASDSQDISEMDPEAMQATFNIMSWMMPLAGGEAYRSAPAIFRDSLTFPYFQGMVFALHLAGDGGWAAIHQAYQRPPTSTEQILHPAKYLSEVDNPQRVTLPDLEQELGEPWTRLGSNCLGELQTSIMLKKVPGGRAAAMGWDGDRYEVYRSSAGHLGLVYVSIWDSEEDAEEFAVAYRKYRQMRAVQPEMNDITHENPLQLKTVENGSEQVANSIFAVNFRQVIERRNDIVWVIEGFSAEVTQRVLSKLPSTTFEEKLFPLPGLTPARAN